MNCPKCNRVMGDVSGTEVAAEECMNPHCEGFGTMLCSKCGRPWDKVVEDGPNRHRLAPSCSCWEKKPSSWDQRFIGMAEHIATWSKDESTKVGCVLVDPKTHAVIALGFNGFPRGVEEQPARWERPTKYLFSEHAERNAVYNAARLGHATEGCWAYVNWDPRESVCADCARALIQAGVVRIIGPSKTVQGRTDVGEGWRQDCTASRSMLSEAAVEVVAL